MKKINNYLLTHYPLIWNLKLHYMWPIILLLHGLFFLAGYCSVSFPDSLSYYSLEPQGGVISMAVLSALVLLVLWLVYYFRNNALKSFYPLKKGLLMTEFLLLFITGIGLTTFTGSYAGAVYGHVRSLTADVRLTDEVNIDNLAHHFLPFNRSNFSVYEDCRYHMRRSLPPDSLKNGRYENEGDSHPVAGSDADTFSYIHYCTTTYSYGDVQNIRTPAANDTIAKRWLYSGRKDSVEYVLTQYLKLCKKYGAEYDFDAGKGAAEVFSTPGFLLRELINSNSGHRDYPEVNSQDGAIPRSTRFIDESRVNYALGAIGTAREGWLTWEAALFFLYFSLGIALLIFSYRVTSVRVWFTALIGTGIWMAIFGVLGALLHGGDYGLMVLFLLLTIAFLIAAAVLIRQRQRKRVAGVLLLWSLCAMPVFVPLLFAFIQRILRPYNYYENERMHTHDSPIYYWIEHHWTVINSLNIAWALVLVGILFIPLARKWQAAPEE